MNKTKIIKTPYGFFSIVNQNEIYKINKKESEKILKEIYHLEKEMHSYINRGYLGSYLEDFIYYDLRNLYFSLQGINVVYYPHDKIDCDINIFYDTETDNNINEKLKDIKKLYFEKNYYLDDIANQHIRGWKEAWKHLNSFEYRMEIVYMYNDLITLMKLKTKTTLNSYRNILNKDKTENKLKEKKIVDNNDVDKLIKKNHEILRKCKKCGCFIELSKYSEHDKKCNGNFDNFSSLNQDIENKSSKLNLQNEKKIKIVEDTPIQVQDEDKLLNLEDKKDELQKENTPKLKEQIPKHQAKTTQYDEKLNPDIITDEEQYQKEFIQKVQEDIKEFEEAKQNEIVQEIVVVRKKSNTKKSKEQRQKIKDYLFDTYKGYCQICGFTFRKVEDGKNSFEMFNWNDKRVVKKKKSFITTADSLCLCRNCSANIKWGAFEPIFMDKINNIEDFANKSLDEVKEAICVELEDNVVKKFKDDYEWEDIYALEITVNDEPKNIYMTNGHLIQFIAYLQLEER